MASENPSASAAAVEAAHTPRPRRSSARWRVGLSVAVILVLMLWNLRACRSGVIPARNEAVAGESAAGLPTQTMALQTLPAATETVGSVQAQQTASVTSRVVAEVLELRVAAGQRVTSGETLAVLDDRDLRHRVEQAQDGVHSAEASLAQARADYARDKPLFEQKVITPYDFEHTKTTLDIAQANVHRLQQAEREAEVGLSYAIIRSPFTGTVVDTLANVGDLAAPGKPLLTMYEHGRLWFAANVPENLLGRIHLGDHAGVPDRRDRSRAGRASRRDRALVGPGEQDGRRPSTYDRHDRRPAGNVRAAADSHRARTSIGAASTSRDSRGPVDDGGRGSRRASRAADRAAWARRW